MALVQRPCWLSTRQPRENAAKVRCLHSQFLATYANANLRFAFTSKRLFIWAPIVSFPPLGGKGGNPCCRQLKKRFATLSRWARMRRSVTGS
jgi:hypothetical protein